VSSVLNFYETRRFILEDSKENYETQFHKPFKSYSNNFTVLEETALSTLDEILWFLKDGKWHNLTEIIEKSPSTKPTTEMALSFLQEYNFIQIDENERKAKLHPPVLNFINEIQRVEKEEASTHKSFEGTISVNEFESLSGSLEKV